MSTPEEYIVLTKRDLQSKEFLLRVEYSGRKPACWQCDENRHLSAVFTQKGKSVENTQNHRLFSHDTNKTEDLRNGVILPDAVPETEEKTEEQKYIINTIASKQSALSRNERPIMWRP